MAKLKNPQRIHITDIKSHHMNPTTLLFLTFMYSIYATSSLDITCNSGNPCEDQTLSCNPNENCTVYCSGIWCHNANISAPTNANLTIHCSEGGSMSGNCEAIHVDARDTTGLTVYCDTKNACGYMTLLCPTHGHCHIYCGFPGVHDMGFNTEHFCKWMILDARGMQSGSFVLKSHGQVQQPSMRDANVYCPGNGLNCSIECGRYGCFRTKFHTQGDTARLEINAFGIETLEYADIYCPRGVGSSCIVHTTGAGPDMLTGARIYTVDGLNQVSLSCDYANNAVTDCYSAASSPTLISCTGGSGEGCTMELVSNEIDVWQCTQTLPTNFSCPTTELSHFPTITPSKNPTQYTSAPTRNPTVTPSKNPTQYPTVPPVTFNEREVNERTTAGGHGSYDEDQQMPNEDWIIKVNWNSLDLSVIIGAIIAAVVLLLCCSFIGYRVCICYKAYKAHQKHIYEANSDMNADDKSGEKPSDEKPAGTLPPLPQVNEAENDEEPNALDGNNDADEELYEVHPNSETTKGMATSAGAV